MHWLFHVACALGTAVSAYAVYVEQRVSEDDEYVALCDFSPAASCSKVKDRCYGALRCVCCVLCAFLAFGV